MSISGEFWCKMDSDEECQPVSTILQRSRSADSIDKIKINDELNAIPSANSISNQTQQQSGSKRAAKNVEKTATKQQVKANAKTDRQSELRTQNRATDTHSNSMRSLNIQGNSSNGWGIYLTIVGNTFCIVGAIAIESQTGVVLNEVDMQHVYLVNY